jgi:hypothetical protein
VDDECRAVASAPEGQRNDALNRAAFALGTLVGAHALSRREAEARLMGAAYACGLDQREAEATIRSGLDAGEQHPRKIEQREQRQHRQHRDQPRAERGEHDDQPPEDAILAAGATIKRIAPARGRQVGRLRLLSVADALHADPRPYLIKTLLHAGDLAVIYGEPVAGKTFLATDMAYRLSLGLPIFGMRTSKASVIYAALEGESGIAKRIRALRDVHGESPDFNYIAQPVPLGEDGTFAGDLAEAAAATDARLIVLDTLARLMAGLDETAAADMTTMIARLDTIRLGDERRPPVAMLIVHHRGKDKLRGARGSSALRGAVDLEIEVEASASGQRTWHVTKAKDDPGGGAHTFTLRPVTIGTDCDGDAVTTCIVEEGGPAAPMGAQRAPTGQAALALRYLHDVIVAEGGTLPAAPGFPPPPHPGVRLERWRDACRDRALAAGDAAAQRQAFHRVKTALVTAGHVAIGAAQGITYAWSVRP